MRGRFNMLDKVLTGGASFRLFVNDTVFLDVEGHCALAGVTGFKLDFNCCLSNLRSSLCSWRDLVLSVVVFGHIWIEFQKPLLIDADSLKNEAGSH